MLAHMPSQPVNRVNHELLDRSQQAQWDSNPVPLLRLTQGNAGVADVRYQPRVVGNAENALGGGWLGPDALVSPNLRSDADSTLARNVNGSHSTARRSPCYVARSPSPREGKWSGAPCGSNGGLSSPCRFDRSGSLREPIGLVVQ